MPPFLRMLGSALLGLLLATAPVAAVAPEGDAPEAEGVSAPAAATRPAIPAPPRAAAARRVTSVSPRSSVGSAADRSHTLPVRLHVLHCVWRE